MALKYVRFLALTVLAVIIFFAGRWTAPVSDGVAGDFGLRIPPAAHLDSSNQDKGAPHNMDTNQAVGLGANSPKIPVSTHTNYLEGLEYAKQLFVLAESNPQAAMAQCQQLKGQLRQSTELGILELWGAKDPYGAWNWTNQLDSRPTPKLLKLLEVIARKDAQIASGYADKLAAENHELRKDIYLALVSGMAQSGNYMGASSLLKGLTIESQIKAELVNYVAGIWVDYEPQAALQWVMAQPDGLSAQSIGRLGDSWVDANPEAAAQFAAKAPTGQLASLLEKAFSKWLASDPIAAGNWLVISSSGADFDALYAEAATQKALIASQPKTALQLTERIVDHDQRYSALTSVLAEIKLHDAVQAKQLLLSVNGISFVERAQLQESLVLP